MTRGNRLHSQTILQSAVQLTGATSDFDSLLAEIGEARFVLIGEASHGTHEFYHLRAAITKRLIEERDFKAIVAEADWPDAYRVNRFVRGIDDDGDATDALADFKRFPQWMWRNSDVLDFVGWLRDHNDSLPPRTSKCGFYGMDLYSLHASIGAVLSYLAKVDPDAAARARYRYSCFEHFGEDPQAYGYAAGFDLSQSCESEVVTQLTDLRKRAAEYAKRDGRIAEDEYFYAEQNAQLIKNAEEYYRSMFGGRASTWNLRDTHMVQTLDALVKHLDRHTGRTKVVVWAHNSHLGDARATDMGQGGEVNVGQLVRERWPDECFNIGFSTYSGTVTAATDWDGPAERKRVRPGIDGSYELLFHEVLHGDGLLILRNRPELSQVLPRRLERAIGVIYRPETERISHYFHADLPRQFDAMIHVDHSRAVEPLERSAMWRHGDLPETYPIGV